MRLVLPVSKESGVRTYDFAASEAGDDWFKYGRLRKLADAGDEEARKECERMDNSEMVELEDDDIPDKIK